MATKKFYVRLGGAVGDVGEIKYGFYANEVIYEGIKDELGVVEISDDASARGVAFGINTPKPPRVRLSGELEGAGGAVSEGRSYSVVRFCDPDKLGRVLNGSLNNATVKTTTGRTISINQASMAS